MVKLFRRPKIESVLEHELNNLLLRDFDFDGTLVTIISVEVSDDLGQAKVRISVIPKEKSLEVSQALEKKRREVQHKLLKKTRLRSVPKLVFEIENH
jgi:ribosome-binding factor A